MVVSQQVPHLVHHHGQQIDAVLLTLVAGPQVFCVTARRGIHKPAPAGRIIVQPDGAAGSQTQCRAAQVADPEIDTAQ